MELEKRPRFPLPWLIGGIVVVGLVVVASLLAGRQPEQLSPDTPEGTVQGYLQAVSERDFVAAHRYLEQSLAEKCTLSDFRSSYVPERWSASIESVETQGAETVVTARIEEPTGDLFGDGYRHDEVLYLERGPEGWRITQTPWPVYFCEAK